MKRLHWWSLISTNKGSVTLKMFPLDDVITLKWTHIASYNSVNDGTNLSCELLLIWHQRTHGLSPEWYWKRWYIHIRHNEIIHSYSYSKSTPFHGVHRCWFSFFVSNRGTHFQIDRMSRGYMFCIAIPWVFHWIYATWHDRYTYLSIIAIRNLWFFYPVRCVTMRRMCIQPVRTSTYCFLLLQI